MCLPVCNSEVPSQPQPLCRSVPFSMFTGMKAHESLGRLGRNSRGLWHGLGDMSLLLQERVVSWARARMQSQERTRKPGKLSLDQETLGMEEQRSSYEVDFETRRGTA